MMAMPIALSDEQMDAVMAAARPLAPDLRSPFLAAVAHALRGVPVGDGSVHRIICDVQKEFFDPPDLSHGAPRWSRSR